MEVVGNGRDLRAAGRKENALYFGVGGRISGDFGRIFWLLVGAVRLT